MSHYQQSLLLAAWWCAVTVGCVSVVPCPSQGGVVTLVPGLNELRGCRTEAGATVTILPPAVGGGGCALRVQDSAFLGSVAVGDGSLVMSDVRVELTNVTVAAHGAAAQHAFSVLLGANGTNVTVSAWNCTLAASSVGGAATVLSLVGRDGGVGTACAGCGMGLYGSASASASSSSGAVSTVLSIIVSSSSGGGTFVDCWLVADDVGVLNSTSATAMVLAVFNSNSPLNCRGCRLGDEHVQRRSCCEQCRGCSAGILWCELIGADGCD